MPLMLLLRETALYVSVPDECDCGNHDLERGPGIAHAKDVLILVQRGSVRKRDLGLPQSQIVGLERPLGKFAKPLDVVA